MRHCGDAFIPLQDATFYPALLEGDVSDAECELFSLPTSFAGLGINNPAETASSSYHISPGTIKRTRQTLEEIARQKFDGVVLALFPPGQQCAIRRTVQGSGTIQRWPCPALHLICQPHVMVLEISHSSMPLTARKARVILHHNEIRDCIGDMASQMWPQVIKEPVVNEAASVISGDPELTLDLAIRGP